MNARQKTLDTADDFFRRKTHQLAKALVQDETVLLEMPAPGAHLGRAQGGLEPRLTRLQGSFGAVQFGEVDQHVDRTDDLPARRIAERFGVGQDVRPNAILALDDDLFAADAPALSQRDGHRALLNREIGTVRAIEFP